MKKYDNKMRNLFEANISQMWFNAQKMEIDERKNTIAYIVSLTRTNGGFTEYAAKFFLAQLIHNSEPYFNGLGYTTKVKEFEKQGWYIEVGKNNYGDPMYSLDFNRVMQ